MGRTRQSRTRDSRTRYGIRIPLCPAAALAVAATLAMGGCAASGSASPAVPSISAAAGGQPTGAQLHGAGSARATALHAAAQCIRQHGIPGYADPVLTPTGQVYNDLRSIEDAPDSVLMTVNQACASLVAQANLSLKTEPPAPPQLVRAGVLAASCMRAHGLPHIQDPTAQTPYTPGHGFLMGAAEMPPGGKQSPLWKTAYQACRAQWTAELQASTLASLGNDS